METVCVGGRSWLECGLPAAARWRPPLCLSLSPPAMGCLQSKEKEPEPAPMTEPAAKKVDPRLPFETYRQFYNFKNSWKVVTRSLEATAKDTLTRWDWTQTGMGWQLTDRQERVKIVLTGILSWQGSTEKIASLVKVVTRCRRDTSYWKRLSEWFSPACCLLISQWCKTELGHRLVISQWCGTDLGHGLVISQWCGTDLGHRLLISQWCGTDLGHCSGSAGASVVAHSVALPLYRDCFLDLRLFNSPDLRRLVLCYCCQAWTLETVLGGNTALTRWWTARSIDADAKR